jgi:hypothetical protein
MAEEMTDRWRVVKENEAGPKLDEWDIGETGQGCR